MGEGLPPQRRQGGGMRGGPGGPRGGRSAGSPKEGAEEAERRLGKPCFHIGQKVVGRFACVACQFQIRNRGQLPSCPDCGELVWAYMDDGPRPVPEGEAPGDAPATPAAQAGPVVQENVKLDAPVSIQENVKLEP
ncbi:MAG: hypothetical protein ACLGG9_11620 [Thermoleophilia bacterium]